MRLPCFLNKHPLTSFQVEGANFSSFLSAVSSGVSFLLATTLSVLLFAGMQMYKSQLAGQDYMTIVGGFLGSNLFILLLTAVGNFETATFGSGFQTKLFPEGKLKIQPRMWHKVL